MLDKNGYSAAVLMDLSKAFDTVNNDLLIAKLYAYCIRGSSLNFLKNHLSNRFQRKQEKYKMDPGELNVLKQFCQSINNVWTKS